MSRKSKTVSIANDATLTNAGFMIDGDNYYQPEDTSFAIPMTRDEAYAAFTRANGANSEKKRRPAENRATNEIVALVRRVCQAYSNNFTARGVWGEEEISLKKVVASAIQIFVTSNSAIEGAIVPSELVIKNAVNALKRNGEIEGTKKGYFRASAQASIDWSQFV